MLAADPDAPPHLRRRSCAAAERPAATRRPSSSSCRPSECPGTTRSARPIRRSTRCEWSRAIGRCLRPANTGQDHVQLLLRQRLPGSATNPTRPAHRPTARGGRPPIPTSSAARTARSSRTPSGTRTSSTSPPPTVMTSWGRGSTVRQRRLPGRRDRQPGPIEIAAVREEQRKNDYRWPICACWQTAPTPVAWPPAEERQRTRPPAHADGHRFRRRGGVQRVQRMR